MMSRPEMSRCRSRVIWTEPEDLVAFLYEADELHLAFQLSGPDQVRHKDEAAVENAHKHGVLVVEPVIQLVAQLPGAVADLVLGDEDLQDILIHVALSHCGFLHLLLR